jgi:competence CoiA-like predicted nuclease
MIYAIDELGERITASPQNRATCPVCNSSVIARCGSINVWHWAHENADDCDPWSEGETLWHLMWKNAVPEGWREVALGPHRADICTPEGFVVELQNSPINPAEIQKRENFYKKMCWIFNVSDCFKRFKFKQKNEYVTFRWKNPRKAIAYAKMPAFLDFEEDKLFWLKKLHVKNGRPTGGWGCWITYQAFYQRYLFK